jgi:Xaa-Pro aminopeptidase
MKKAGLPKMIHSIGHGIGLQVHEFPRFNKKYKDKIRQSTFTIEPAVYFKDFGVRYEETVYYDNRKAVVL